MTSEQPITVYTDGSASPNPGPGGWAFVAVFPSHEVQSNGREKYTTNNIMEMTAVMEALRAFKQQKLFHIHSDSMYVINCAQKIWQRKKNVDLWREFDELMKGKTIKWTWVRGHTGDYYNEMVDKLAKG